MCKFGLSLSNVWRTKYSPNQNSYTRRCPDKKVIFFLSTPDIMVVWEGPDNHKSLILSEKWGKVSPWLLMIFLRLPSKGGEVPLPDWFEYMNKTCSRLMNSPYSYIDQHPCDEILYLTIKKKRCKSPFKHSMMLLQPRGRRCKNSIFNQHHQYEKLLFDNFIRLLKLSPNCWSSVATLLDYFKFNQIADSPYKLF